MVIFLISKLILSLQYIHKLWNCFSLIVNLKFKSNYIKYFKKKLSSLIILSILSKNDFSWRIYTCNKYINKKDYTVEERMSNFFSSVSWLFFILNMYKFVWSWKKKNTLFLVATSYLAFFFIIIITSWFLLVFSNFFLTK